MGRAPSGVGTSLRAAGLRAAEDWSNRLQTWLQDGIDAVTRPVSDVKPGRCRSARATPRRIVEDYLQTGR